MMAEFITAIVDWMLSFAFYYPLFMAYLWMAGAIYYYYHWERSAGAGVDQPPELTEYPPVSIIVPCFNEGENVRETIAQLTLQEYPAFEIIAVNDGSIDDTGAILDELATQYPQLRVIHLAQNEGKAVALRMGTLVSKHEFLVCIDGDTLLDKYAVTWMMKHFVSGPRVAAVTGNPRIRTRSTLLGRIQVGEFSAIIGMIKRAQRIYGRVFTVSGVIAAFRKSALHDVGYWSPDMVTEDIDISWKLQLRHWDIRFETHALCWILMPETFAGLWKQRVRWSQGGTEVLIKYLSHIPHWKMRRMWPVYLEYFTSVFWAYVMLIVFGLWVAGQFVELPPPLTIPTLLPGWNGVVLGVTCLLQFAISLAIDSRYERGIGKTYYWMVWYPIGFWLLSVITTVVAVPKAWFKKKGTRATWVSPDRGVH